MRVFWPLWRVISQFNPSYWLGKRMLLASIFLKRLLCSPQQRFKVVFLRTGHQGNNGIDFMKTRKCFSKLI